MIKVAFRYADTRLVARLICWVRGGDSAHCEVVHRSVADMHACISASWVDGGVREKIMALPAAKWRIYEVAGDPLRARAWLAEHDGKGYDLMGLLGFIRPWARHSRKRWFCSEAAANILDMDAAHLYDVRIMESVCIKHGTRLQ